MEPATMVAAGSPQAIKLYAFAIEAALKGLKEPLKSLTRRTLATLSSYGPYLEETHSRVSTFKTFANPTQPVPVLDHFVDVDLYRKKERFGDQTDLLERLRKPSRVVVTALAGYGKSMLMRYLALAMFENPMGKIPLFLELRHLNRVNFPDILTYINSSYRKSSKVDIEVLRQGLQSGAFVLLLDGFDELNHDIRPLVESQILELTRAHPKCSVLVSGRLDDRFGAWRSFTVLKIAPMSKSRVKQLVRLLEYDKGTKQRFIKEIDKGLYETHESFLSTPLLAILMLLTYEQNANIPDKIHLFYAKAFETLFHKHDAMKEQYGRARKSGLAVDEFEKVFSIFCLKTYVLEKTEFTKTELLRVLAESIEFERLETNNEDLLFDIEEAVCLIMREGTSYFFVHRSFQEYFTALFLSNCPEDIRNQFIDEVASRYWDGMLAMLFDMASAQIEPGWVEPKVEEYFQAVGAEKGKMSPVEGRVGALRIHSENGGVFLSSFSNGPFSKTIFTLRTFYPDTMKNAKMVDFKVIDEFIRGNWGTICGEMEPDRTLEEGKIKIFNLPLQSVPLSVLKNSGIVAFCDEEFKAIKEVLKSVDRGQRAKNQFIDKLFSSRKSDNN